MVKKMKQDLDKLLDELYVVKGYDKPPRPYDLAAEIPVNKGAGSDDILAAIERIIRKLISIALGHQKFVNRTEKSIKEITERLDNLSKERSDINI